MPGMYKLVFFCPIANTQAVKQALFKLGAGKIGEYSNCAYVTRGTGEFLPSGKANPAVGKRGEVEYVVEDKVEMVIDTADRTRSVVAALKEAHPYEEPAYEVYRLEDF